MLKVFKTLLLISLSFSCTVQKRVHNRGYFVQWNKNFVATSKVEKQAVFPNEICSANSEIDESIICNKVEIVDSIIVSSESKHELKSKKDSHFAFSNKLKKSRNLPEKFSSRKIKESTIEKNKLKPNFFDALLFIVLTFTVITLLLLVLFLILALGQIGLIRILFFLLSFIFLVLFCLGIFVIYNNFL